MADSFSLAQRYCGDAMSFAMGWFYWYLWTILLPAELSAVAVLFGFWLPDVNPAAWIILALVVVTILNSCSVRVYGESEFWFASLKVILIVGLILASIIVTAGGNPKHETIGFRYWKTPNGPFRQYKGIDGALGRFLGFWATLTRAAFGYVGLGEYKKRWTSDRIPAYTSQRTSRSRLVRPRTPRTRWPRLSAACGSASSSSSASLSLS
jgi:amino acid transporter